MRSFIGSRLRRLLHPLGLDIIQFNIQHPDFILKRELARQKITTTLDVGANRGQFARRMRRYGFQGFIHSFEPLPGALAELKGHAARDPRWQVHAFALGSEEGKVTFYVGENDQTSSLLLPNQRNLDATETARTVQKIDVPVRRLKTVAKELRLDPKECFLKVDVQGAEAAVIKGAGDFLGQLPLLQIETSLDPLYEGETSFWPIVEYVRAAGFSVMSLMPGFQDPRTGVLLQADVIFSRLSK